MPDFLRHLLTLYLRFQPQVDACVPEWGSEEWTRDLGFPIKEEWRPWLAASRDEPTQGDLLAGYVTTYDAGSQDFTFLTVHGAGHLGTLAAVGGEPGCDNGALA